MRSSTLLCVAFCLCPKWSVRILCCLLRWCPDTFFFCMRCTVAVIIFFCSALDNFYLQYIHLPVGRGNRKAAANTKQKEKRKENVKMKNENKKHSRATWMCVCTTRLQMCINAVMMIFCSVCIIWIPTHNLLGIWSVFTEFTGALCCSRVYHVWAVEHWTHK